MSIVFDPKKDRANQVKHGVSLVEADGVLDDPRGLTLEDETAESEQRFVTIGLNLFGFLRVVVWTSRGDDQRIISVRKANRRETKAYEKAL